MQPTNKTIPAIVRFKVWNTYVGEHVGKTLCPLCQLNDIHPLKFHCAYVIAKSNGGSDEVENLRPICSGCNQSMSNYNLYDFAKKYFPNAPIHKLFDQNTSTTNRSHENDAQRDLIMCQQKQIAQLIENLQQLNLNQQKLLTQVNMNQHQVNMNQHQANINQQELLVNQNQQISKINDIFSNVIFKSPADSLTPIDLVDPSTSINPMIKCPVLKPETLKYFVPKSPISQNKLACHVCHKTMANKQNLQNHIKKNVCQRKMDRICQKCLREFNRKKDYEYHVSHEVCKYLKK